MTDYTVRLKHAMQRAQVDTTLLAKALGITYQGVKKIVDGKSQFNVVNHARAARFLGVDSDWLAIGIGRAPESDARPFRDLDPFEGQAITFLRQLSADQKHAVVVALNNMAAGSAPSTANPYGGGRRRGMSAFGELDTEEEPWP